MTKRTKTKRNMTSPEERERRLRRMKRNEAAKALRNFKPKRIENKKKRERYNPPEYDDYDVREDSR